MTVLVCVAIAATIAVPYRLGRLAGNPTTATVRPMRGWR